MNDPGHSYIILLLIILTSCLTIQSRQLCYPHACCYVFVLRCKHTHNNKCVTNCIRFYPPLIIITERIRYYRSVLVLACLVTSQTSWNLCAAVFILPREAKTLICFKLLLTKAFCAGDRCVI